MKTKVYYTLAVVALMIICVTTSCKKTESNSPQPTTQSPTPTPTYTANVNIAVGIDASSWDYQVDMMGQVKQAMPLTQSFTPLGSQNPCTANLATLQLYYSNKNSSDSTVWNLNFFKGTSNRVGTCDVIISGAGKIKLRSIMSPVATLDTTCTTKVVKFQ